MQYVFMKQMTNHQLCTRQDFAFPVIILNGPYINPQIQIALNKCTRENLKYPVDWVL